MLLVVVLAYLALTICLAIRLCKEALKRPQCIAGDHSSCSERCARRCHALKQQMTGLMLVMMLRLLLHAVLAYLAYRGISTIVWRQRTQLVRGAALDRLLRRRRSALPMTGTTLKEVH
jgi:predicted nucleic acid-binding Zn ribbon protein